MRSPEEQALAAQAGPADRLARLERRIRAWGLILWPSFLAACVLEVLVFAMVDPAGLHGSGHMGSMSGSPSDRAVYTVAFLPSGWSACCAAAWCCGWPSHSRRLPLCRSVASLGIDQALERLGVEDADLALMDFNQALVRKLRESAAHGFKLHAQVAANFFARHAQYQRRA